MVTDNPTVGELVDGLGVTGDPLEDGELVESAIVLLKAVDAEGRAGLLIATSAHMDWITQLGIIEAARCIIQSAAADDS